MGMIDEVQSKPYLYNLALQYHFANSEPLKHIQDSALILLVKD